MPLHHLLKAISTISMVCLALVCNTVTAVDTYQNVYQNITEAELSKHIKSLSSDKFMGRAPATEGETLVLNYLTEVFTQLGFQPVSGDSFLQGVELEQATDSSPTKTSYNFIATLPGFENPDEHLIYSTHWDHLGVDRTKKGDKIYNGAQDNATGIAGLLELAKAFSELKLRPARSVTFIAFTGKEHGWLGSEFYTQNPIIPLDKTVANINLDGLNILGKVKEISVIGLGQSELDTYLETAAQKQTRFIVNNPNQPEGYLTPSDHINFAKSGVPSIWARGGVTAVDEETAVYRKNMQVVLDACYRQVCDQYRRNWDLSGAVQDLQLLFDVGFEILNSNEWPKWSKSAAFNRSK